VSEIVVDASAVLALMQSEPGADAVTAVLPGALLGMVNRKRGASPTFS
jgi:PIN domain nuclease of toxin-antitoxin system